MFVTARYLYEQTGMVGLEINGTPYYFVRNLQGDVTKILDINGAVVVEYIYDSWGKVLSVSGSLASTVGEMNPIRYRGYYYDIETELYYLNSRYYDPETGRFISPDVIAEGGNLYTYCQNDPVNRSDGGGCLSWNDIANWGKNAVETVKNGIVAAANAVGIAGKAVAGFFADVYNDINNFDINNTDPQKVEKSKYFSGYGGQFVIRTQNIGGSASFGRIMIMDHYWDGAIDCHDVIKHEHGHYTEQYQELGFAKYLFGIAIPSFVHAINGEDYYHSQLTEVTADVAVSPSLTGNASWHHWYHLPDAEANGKAYLNKLKTDTIGNVIIDCFTRYIW